jgi:hypothetical protein
MKQFVLGIATTAALCGVVALSRSESAPDTRVPADSSVLVIESGDKNPWTSLKLNNDPDQFTFAVVADRTGGHRDKVFSQAVARVNLLQPQFVMSVGDLIEGYTTKEEKIKEEWDEFDGYVKKFEMPFFYAAGNHDVTNKTLVTKWGERYGKKYYSFTYRGVLFLVLCSDNPPAGMGTIDPEQRDWVARTVAAHKDAKWTFVFLHKPIWTAKDLEKNGWAAVEKALAGRKYTVFCGHEHNYVRFERNGAEYLQLATTGGASRMRGQEYGEFDHVAWVTMKKNAPLIANIVLDGVLPSDLRVPESEEKGVPLKKKPTFPVSGRVTAGGRPVAGASVTLHTYNPETEKFAATAEGRTDEMGRFQLTTYAKFDGVPAGEYAVTVTKSDAVPVAFTLPTTTTLKLRILETPNTLNLDLPGK